MPSHVQPEPSSAQTEPAPDGVIRGAIIGADLEKDLRGRRQQHGEKNLEIGIPEKTRRRFGQGSGRHLVVHFKASVILSLSKDRFRIKCFLFKLAVPKRYLRKLILRQAQDDGSN